MIQSGFPQLQRISLMLLATIITGVLGMMTSCSDDDSYTTSKSDLLTFSTDTLRLDTVFSNVPTAHRSLWVHNHSGDGLRLSSVRLTRGAASGFRVNVDGMYLGEATGYGVTDLEVRSGDSIRVYVELTAPKANADVPTLDEDDLVFRLESGAEQKVNLRAMAWDAVMMRHVKVSADTTIDGQGRPIIVYGGIRVDSSATLHIAPGTTLYFHQDAGIDVYGRLLCEGTDQQNVTLRGDRLDRMFDDLPYDRLPGQWQGIRFRASSHASMLTHTDLHGAYDGIRIDSTAVDRRALTLQNSTLHNCQGYGLYVENAQISVTNTQITNTLHHCVSIQGGSVSMEHCTVAQFYPFDSARGVAFHFTNRHPITRLDVRNTLITGYADDVLRGEKTDSTAAMNYRFANSMIRTPKVTTKDSVNFSEVYFENIKDTASYGEKHFVKVDADRQDYDFHLRSQSAAIGKAASPTTQQGDHDGYVRDDKPDIGSYEYRKK